MKAVTKIVRKYYKYVYNPWVRPNLSDFGVLGGDSFACAGGSYSLWHIFDGVDNYGQLWSTNEDTRTLTIYNPKPIQINSVSWTNKYSTYLGEVTWSGSNDGVNYTTIITFSNMSSAASQTKTFPANSGYYKYFKMRVNVFHDYGDIDEMTFNATVQNIVESTVSDYDFYEDVDDYKVFKETIRSYYKYSYQTFNRPNLTANGAIGGDSFAVNADNIYSSSYPAYYAVDGSESSYWLCGNGLKGSFYFYNPNALKITQIRSPRQWTDGGIYTAEGALYGSNDSINWITLGTFTGGTYNNGFSIDVNDQNYYKFFKISATGSRTTWGMNELQITAQERISTISTESDYDYYVDTYTFKAFNV